MWSQPRIVGNDQGLLIITHCGKEQVEAGERGNVKAGQHISRTNILVLVPRDKHNTVQCKHRNEIKKWIWIVE